MDGKMWLCSQCGSIKPLSAFYSRLDRRCGCLSECKECNKTRKKNYRLANVIKLQEQRKIRYEINKLELLERQRKWYETNRDDIVKRRKQWRQENPDKVQATKKRHLAVPKNRIRASISSRIHKAIKGIGKVNWPNCLDYTLQELADYLEKLFKPGMSWDNYGEWHIDHRVPISAFNFEKPEDLDFKRCWALSNLQPLWAKENYIKSDKIEGDESWMAKPCFIH